MKRKQIFIFQCNSRQFYDGGTAVVFAESYKQAKQLLDEQKVNRYYLELADIIDLEDLNEPRVLGAFVHVE